LREGLHAAAEIVDKLQSDGWPMVSGYGAVYDLEFIWEGDGESAKRRLIDLGIAPDEVGIEEVEGWD